MDVRSRRGGLTELPTVGAGFFSLFTFMIVSTVGDPMRFLCGFIR